MAKRRSKAGAKPRASWKGTFSFGLVSFPVQAFNAINRQESDIHFHQLHADCHRRIKYQRVCPVHGEVPNEDIVSGYEYKKGRYVEVDDEELDALRTPAERALTIDAFIDPSLVDPLYFDGRMYYLLPDGNVAQEPYAVLLQALLKEDRVGIGQVVFSGKNQLVLVRPLTDVLHMAMLNYAAEIRPAGQIMTLPPQRRVSRQVRLAQTLIRSWSNDEFEFSQYEDRYREKVQELIDAKVEGREIAVAAAEEEPPQVVNLMEALRQSVAQSAATPRRKRRVKKRRSA